MSGIVWLASYPKSGNTWLRTFLSNFLYSSDKPVDINKLPLQWNPAGHRSVADRIVGLELSDLTAQEIDAYRADTCREVAAASGGELYFKIHDAYLTDTRGEPLIPTDATRGAVYVVRSPLDVAVSFAHHMNCSIDLAIERMADPEFALNATPERLHRMLEQPVLSWSGHVNSWLDQNAFPVHVMRYEDMLESAIETFSACLRFLNLDANSSRISRTLEWSSFDSLRRQEIDQGFKERPPRANSFFRKGEARQWRQCLTADQISKIVLAHGEAMHRLGYQVP